MTNSDRTPTFGTQRVGDVFFRAAGPADAPVVVLLHGFPSTGHMFRDLIPELADTYRVMAPDLPGFGQTRSPGRDSFGYTFDGLAAVIGGFVDALGLASYALFILDYRSNVALYPAFQEYFRRHRPPLLAVWGRNDPFFVPAGAEAYRRDLPDAEVVLLDPTLCTRRSSQCRSGEARVVRAGPAPAVRRVRW